MSRPAVGAQIWASSAAQLAERARLAEQLGFDAVCVPDHLHRTIGAPLLNCAVAAQATSRVRLGTLVLNNDFRHPVLLAHEARALADLSGGRFTLGLGAGYTRSEYDKAGIRYDPGPVRVARLAESVQIVRGLLHGEEVTFEGQHYTVRAERLDPAPATPVPILLGGNSRALHACAAAHADVVGLTGFHTRSGGDSVVVSHFTEDALERQLERLRGLAGGRPLRVQLLVQWYEVTDEREAVLARLAPDYQLTAGDILRSPYVAVGTAAEIADQLLDLHRRLGIDEVTFFTYKPEAPAPETLLPVLERLAAAG